MCSITVTDNQCVRVNSKIYLQVICRVQALGRITQLVGNNVNAESLQIGRAFNTHRNGPECLNLHYRKHALIQGAGKVNFHQTTDPNPVRIMHTV